jgi:predicted transposase/invertase (TIGR01784 family)
LYLGQYRPQRLWRAVAIWAKSSLDNGIPIHYQEFQTAGLLRVIHLDQLPRGESLELNLLALVIDPPGEAQAKLNRISMQIRAIEDDTLELQLVELVEKVLAYKFPNLTPEELANMFGQQELEKTRFYQELVGRGLEQGRQQGLQEGRQEGIILGKLQTVPQLVQLGLSAEQIAEALDLELALVQNAMPTAGYAYAEAEA